MTLYLTERDVAQIVDMPVAFNAVERIMAAHARGEVVDFPRQRVKLPGTVTHLLQGGVAALGLSGFKVYTSSREGARFWVHLFDSESGVPVAVVEADRLGMMRTGAAAGVAAKWLARKDARHAGVIGAGWQARGQILALCHALPLSRIRVYARNQEKLQEFCRQMSEQAKAQIIAVATVEEALRDADVLTTVTTATHPLFDAGLLAPGIHINAVGSNSLLRQELSEAAVRRADVIAVDAHATAKREAGDLFPAREKGQILPERWVELGQIINGWHPGRGNDSQITLFESQGMAIQDIALAAEVVAHARERGMGSVLPY